MEIIYRVPSCSTMRSSATTTDKRYVPYGTYKRIGSSPHMKKLILLIAILFFYAHAQPAQASLTFVNVSPFSDRVDHGSATNLDNMTAGTVVMWARPTDVGNVVTHLWMKGAFDTNDEQVAFKEGTDGTKISFRIERATTRDNATTATGFWAANTWYFLAFTWDTVTPATPKIYKGTLTSSVVLDTDGTSGSGSVDDNSADPFVVGNKSKSSETYNRAFHSNIAWTGVWNRALSLGELQDQQFRPHVTSGNILFTHYGFNGVNVQPDWSGNGNAGTVTGATVSPHVPLRSYRLRYR